MSIRADGAAPPLPRVAFDWKWIVIGASVAFTVYIAVIPLGFLLWQSFRTPQTAATAAVFTLGNYADGVRQRRHLAALLDLDPSSPPAPRSSPSCSARRSRG